MDENQPWYVHLSALMSQGLSVTQALDYYVVEIEGVPAEVWNDMRTTQTERGVSVSVHNAKAALEPEEPEQTELAQ